MLLNNYLYKIVSPTFKNEGVVPRYWYEKNSKINFNSVNILCSAMYSDSV